MNQSEENQQQQHSSSDPPATTTTLISQVENDHQKKLLDLRREGSFDRCWQMVAQKITSPHFWDGAELFLARSPPEYGHPAVREALSRHMRQLLGIIIRWEDLLLVPNEYVALQAFVHGICTAGDVILSPAPFADPDLATILAEHTAVELRPVRLESRMELGLADLEKARQSVEEEEGRRVRALLLYNPHSLLGTVSPARLARILEWTNEHDLFLLVAESLAPLDLWEFSSCLGLDCRGQFGQQRLFWLWSGAKHFSLPGLEFAALLAPKPADRSHHLCADRVRSFVRAHSCAPLVQFLTAKLLDDFDWASELFAKRKSRLVELRAQMLDGLARQGLRTMRTGSTMAMWILLDMRKFLPKEDLQDSEGALRKEFADKGMLLLNSGQQLGMDPPESGGCWFRLRIGESEREVVQVLHRLQTVLAGKRPAEEELELFASDVGDGKAVVWDEDGIGADHHLAEEMIADEEEQGRNEEEEEGGQEDIGSEEKEEQFVPTSSTSSAQFFLQEEFCRADNGKRMSMIREEEEAESEELLRQVFAFQQDGGLKMDGASKEETKEADEVMRQVFAIFPSQQMRWNPPEQYSKKDEKRNEEGVRNGLDAMREVEEKNNEENDEKDENGEKVEKDEKDYNEEKDENDESNMEVVKAKVEKKQRMAKSEAKLEEKKVDQKPMLMQPQVQTTLTDFSFIEELVRSSADAEQLEQRIGEERIGERTLAESSSSRQEMPLAIDSNEFYDEASTEEEEKEEEKREEEEVKLAPEEEFTPISPISNRQQHDQPLLTISVPILVDKQTAAAADNFHHQQQANEPAAGQFGESSDSRRIIDIIDQIFHDAVQIRDFSSSNDSHSNQQAFTQSQQQEDVHHQQHQHQQQHWSRSDSGLAADSPVDFLSFSPMLLEHHQQQLHSIEERVELSQQPTEVVPMPMVESPEPTRNEVSLFEVFQNGDPVPLPTTSSLTRKFCREEEEEEEERQLGPVAQMLDDSGIFVEMPPGSLSIDFPLRVPADQLRRRRSSEGGMMAEERTPSFEEHEAEEGQRRRLTVDLQFKTSLPAEARHGQRVWEEDNNLVLMEYDQQLVASKTTVNDNEIGWAPLESLEDADEPPVFTPRIVRVESLAGFEDEDTMEDEQSRQAADALNQGSAFCPSPSPVETHRETIFGGAEEEKMPATAVPVWKPLDQLSPAEKATGLESRGEGESAAEGDKIDDGSKKMKKFSDTLDELEQEAAEEQQKRSRNTEEYTLGMEASKAEKMAPQSRRGHSEEPMEVVSAWNARMAKKMAEVAAEQPPMTKVSVEERNSMETHSEMTLPVPGMEKVHRRVGGWEEEAAARPSEVEEVREGSHRVKTVVKLTSGGHPPKKPSRTFGRRLIRHRELEEMEEGSVEMEREEMRRGKASDRPDPSTRVRIEAAESEEGKVAPFPADAVEEIPGRSRSYQVHHRMQMRRKEHKKQRKLRAHSRDRVVLEHTNITEVAYAGGRLGQRMEHGERLITCISTRINRFAPDEFFRHMPVGPELREKREHLKKVVHTRISRSHSVPSMSGGGQKGKDDEEEAGIGRTQIETVTIIRLDGDNEGVGKEEEAAIAEKIKTGADELHCRLKQEKQQQHQHEEDKGGGDHPSSVYLLCQNAEHSAAKDHCDPGRLYSIRRHISEMSENGYKKMKRLHEGRTVDDDEEDGDKGEDELHSEFKTVDYEMPESIEAETAQKRRRTSAKHSKQRRRIREQPAFVSPSRITVTTTRTTQRDGRTAGPAGIGGECDNHVTVRHTPCSNWVVSSVYRTTEYGWEKTALNKKRNGTAAAAEVRS